MGRSLARHAPALGGGVAIWTRSMIARYSGRADRVKQLLQHEDSRRLLLKKCERRIGGGRAKPLASSPGQEPKNLRSSFYRRDPAFHLDRDILFTKAARTFVERDGSLSCKRRGLASVAFLARKPRAIAYC